MMSSVLPICLPDITSSSGIFGVHPRVQKDFYKNTPRMDDFALAMQKINPDKTILCYNGDITDTNSFKALTDCFPDID